MSSKYEFIDAEKARYPVVVKMCEWMAVSTSGFYRMARPAELGDDGPGLGPGPRPR